MTMASLFESVMKSSNVWTGKDGVKGVQDLLGNSQLQDKIQGDLIKTNYTKLVDSGAIQRAADPVKSLLGKVMSDTGFSKVTSNPLGSLDGLKDSLLGNGKSLGDTLGGIKSSLSGSLSSFKSALSGAGIDVSTGRVAAIDAQAPAITAKIDGIIGGLDIENKISGIKGSIGSTLGGLKSSGVSMASGFGSSLTAAGVDIKTGSVPAIDAAFASGGASGGLGALSNLVGVKGGVPASFASKIDAIKAEVESDTSEPKKINQFKLAKLLDAPLLPQLGPDATLGDVKNMVTGKLDGLKSSGLSAAGQFGSSLSAAGVDVTTGKVSAIDAAFASGGISGAASSLGRVMGSVSSSGTAKLGGLLENASKFGAGTATDWAKGALPSGDLAASMNSLAKQGEFAVNFPEMKLPSAVTGPAPLGAFGGTVDRSTLDSAMSKIVGSGKIGLPAFGGNFEQALASGTKDEDLTYTGNDNIAWERVNDERLRRGLPGLTELGYPRPPD
jgi:hypothetical protein